MTCRPRAEQCERLTAASLRPLLTPGATQLQLDDGQRLTVRWQSVRGCYGSGTGRCLVVICPCCAAVARVLWRPPGRSWGCWRCCPVSHRSHRRPGSHRTRKPALWHQDAICAEQDRIAVLLFGPIGTGLRRGWRDRLPLIWGLRDLRALQRHPDAPRISRRRFDALVERLDALEHLRVLQLIAGCPFRDRLNPPGDEQPRLMAAYYRATLYLTDWALRRPGRDPRSLARRRKLLIALPDRKPTGSC